ncbi:MAG: hypothetical protein A2V70_19490 [Planctomycetes bacterium RBG_13_63_9]|nr:MAG: hypothetical protein A2V70_19490 [Planctomycetes bacterium RBG_13_63_9]
MARVDATKYVERWKTGITQNTGRIREGIERVSVSPTQQAAAAIDRTLANLIKSFQDGTWAAGLKKVDLQSWKDSTIRKGLERIAGGVERVTDSQQAMATKLLSAIDATLSEVNKTPRGDLESNISRSAAMIRGMAKRGAGGALRR